MAGGRHDVRPMERRGASSAVGMVNGNGEDEPRSEAGSIALHPDAATVSLDDPSADRQPQAGPLQHASPAIVVSVREPPEERGESVFRNSRPLVGDRHRHVGALMLTRQPDGRGFRSGRCGYSRKSLVLPVTKKVRVLVQRGTCPNPLV